MMSLVTSLRIKTDIEQANIKYLPELLLCADDTPLWKPDMITEFSYTGDTIAGDKVIEGNYIPPVDTDERTNLFLLCICQPTHKW